MIYYECENVRIVLKEGICYRTNEILCLGKWPNKRFIANRLSIESLVRLTIFHSTYRHSKCVCNFFKGNFSCQVMVPNGVLALFVQRYGSI